LEKVNCTQNLSLCSNLFTECLDFKYQNVCRDPVVQQMDLLGAAFWISNSVVVLEKGKRCLECIW